MQQNIETIILYHHSYRLDPRIIFSTNYPSNTGKVISNDIKHWNKHSDKIYHTKLYSHVSQPSGKVQLIKTKISSKSLLTIILVLISVIF